MAVEKRYSVAVDGQITQHANAAQAEAEYSRIVKEQAFEQRAEFLETHVLGAVEKGVVTVAKPRKPRKPRVKKNGGKK